MREYIFLEEYRRETRGKMHARAARRGGNSPQKGEDDAQKPPLDENLPLQTRNSPFGGKTGKIPGRRGRKRGRFQEDGEEGKKTGKISLPETGKMDTGKQQKGGRLREKGKIWTEGKDWQPHTRETQND